MPRKKEKTSHSGQKPKYNGKGKTAKLQEFFGPMPLEKSERPVLAVAYNATLQQTQIFTNRHQGVSAVDAMDASTASPTLFPPKKIGDQLYIEGGLVAYNPILCAYAEAFTLFGKQADIRILSIGTGHYQDVHREPGKIGTLEWLKGDLVNILSNDNLAQKHAEIFIGKRNILRINPSIDIKPESDNYSQENIKNLNQLGTQWFTSYRDQITDFLFSENLKQVGKTSPSNSHEGPHKKNPTKTEPGPLQKLSNLAPEQQSKSKWKIDV